MSLLRYSQYSLLLALLFIFISCQPKSTEPLIVVNEESKPTELTYPETRMGDVTDTYFGVTIPDPYRWIEDDLSEETTVWVNKQNEVTYSYLKQIPYRDAIKKRLESIWNYEKVSSPSKHGEYFYFYRNDGLQNQSVLYRTKSQEESEAELFLDPNTFSANGTTSLAGISFSNDGSLVAYMISEGGSDWRKAIVRDTESFEQIGDTLIDIKFSGLSWYKNEGFYYSSYEKPAGSQLSAKTQYHKLYYHAIGTSQSDDILIFGGEDTPRRYIGGYVTEDDRFLIVSASISTSGNELYYIDLSNPNSDIIPLINDFDNNHSVVTNTENILLVHTNFLAPNYRLVSINLAQPDKSNWSDIIPEKDQVLSVNRAGDYLFATYLVDVKNEVIQLNLKGEKIREVILPDIGTVYGFGGKNSDTLLYYTFTSFTYPQTIFQYDIKSGKSTLYWQPNIDFNFEDYTTEQIFYESKDGTKIPMFITYKNSIKMDGSNPIWLYGYGGFNVNLRPSFNVPRLIWLEQGGIYAQPNIRGGGEYGEKWHLTGTKMNKQNVFDDFIAAGEYLIDNGYTQPSKLAIAGGSNGGLLVGAVMTQRPDLIAVAHPAVGVLDMLRYHTFTAGAGWAYDYGTSEESEEMFRYLLGYSPVHNVEDDVSYPATLITTADHDDRVVPAHSFKFIAELQKKHNGQNPVLIRIETDAGHGAGKPTAKIIDEWADKYAFTWFNMNVTPSF